MAEHKRWPFLVQRIRRRKYDPPASAKGVDAAFEFDYMGSAEFEWGTLSKALREIRGVELAAKTINLVVDDKKVKLYYVGSADAKVFEQAREWARVSAAEEHPRRGEKEYSGFWATLRGITDRGYHGYDAWWCVDEGWPWVVFLRQKHAALWVKLLGDKKGKSDAQG